LAFTDAGRVALLRWEFAGQQPGPLETFLPEGMKGERVVQLLVMPQDPAGASVGLLSSDGRFKRLPIEEFQELSGRATSVLKLKEGVTLKRAVLCRDTQGPVLLRLLPGEAVVGAVGLSEGGSVVMASRQGLIQRLPLDSLRRCQRGDIGQIGVRFEQRGDQLVDLCNGSQPLLGVLLADGRSLRLDATSLDPDSGTDAAAKLSLGPKDQITELVPPLS
jgi:DNA gyrase subunit A